VVPAALLAPPAPGHLTREAAAVSRLLRVRAQRSAPRQSPPWRPHCSSGEIGGPTPRIPVRANIVCPGAIETEISDNTQQRHTEAAEVPAEYPAGEIPLTGERPGRAKDIAELVLFLSSNRSRHISGSPVWIDGAQSLLV
jgi:NAD(P)-dependent dehydrogenase (short-subunit alcohol dehydrogenase family)